MRKVLTGGFLGMALLGLTITPAHATKYATVNIHVCWFDSGGVSHPVPHAFTCASAINEARPECGNANADGDISLLVAFDVPSWYLWWSEKAIAWSLTTFYISGGTTSGGSPSSYTMQGQTSFDAPPSGTVLITTEELKSM